MIKSAVDVLVKFLTTGVITLVHRSGDSIKAARAVKRAAKLSSYLGMSRLLKTPLHSVVG